MRTVTRRSLNSISSGVDTTLKLWLKADAISGLADGDAVATWPDSSGNGNNATEATNRPVYKTGILNGLPGVLFTAASTQKLTTPSFLSSAYNTALTYYIVAPRAATGLEVVFSHGGAVLYAVNYNDLGGKNFMCNTSGLTDSQVKRSYKTTDAGSVIQGFSYNGTTKRFTLNRLRHTEAATGNLGLNGSLTIGALSNNTFWFNGHICEIMIYNAAHSIEQMDRIMGSLCQKYGIAEREAFFLFEGDSLTFGTGTETPYPTQLMTLYGNPGWALSWNHGTGGSKVSDMDGDQALLASCAMNETKNILALWGGTNDLFAGVSGADTYTLLANYSTALKADGWKVVLGTTLPRQDAGVPGGFETQRAILNGLITANYATIGNGLADMAADVRLQDPTNATYFLVDKVHLSTVGYGVVAGIVKTAMDALL